MKTGMCIKLDHVNTLINQYQACLYLSECIFHCGFTYGHEIPQFRHFFTYFVTILTCRLHSPAALKALIGAHHFSVTGTLFDSPHVGVWQHPILLIISGQ